MDSPRASIAYTSGSSSGTESMSGRTSSAASTRSSVRSIVDRLRRPRKSILSRPSCSIACISNWVTISLSSPFCWIGTISISGCGEITTAAAWIESCRRRPSRPRAVSITRAASGSDAYISRSPAPAVWWSRSTSSASGPAGSRVCSRVASRPRIGGGIALAILSPSPYEKPSTLALSRIA